MKTYKCYSFDGTDYTDISEYIINDVSIPVLQINPDQTPIVQSLNLESVEDLTSTGNSLLDIDLIVSLEIDSAGTPKKVWYGYVESSHYDYSSKTWSYNILNIFEKLKSKTCYTDLYPNITGLGTAQTCNIYSGSSAITWRDITLKTLIEHIVESSSYSGLTHTVTWSYGTGFLQTVLENFCVSSLCIKQLGTDYSDEELTGVTVDPEVSVWDLLIHLFKILGLRYYYTDALAITIVGSDTAPSTTDYKASGSPYDSGKYVNNYDYNVKKEKELKKFIAKQNILNMIMYENETDTHRYFTPLIYGIPLIPIYAMAQTGNITTINFFIDHKIPLNASAFQDLRFINVFNSEEMYGEVWSVKSANEINFKKDINDTEGRYLQTNLGESLAISDITKPADSKIATVTIEAMTGTYDINVTTYGLMQGTKDLCNYGLNGRYVYETGTGTPSGVGYYRKNSNTEIVLYTHIDYDSILDVWDRILYEMPIVSGTITSGTVEEHIGTVGDPKYIEYTEKITDSGINVIKIWANDHSIVTTDTVTIKGSKAIDGRYVEQTVLASLTTGEYYIKATNVIYILDGSQAIDSKGYIKPIFPKYQSYKNLTEGNEEQAINLMDYLVIYYPTYLSTGTAPPDWYMIDMESTTEGLLLGLASFIPWWLYTYNTSYQTVKTETYNLDDTVTPIYTTARKISYNVKDHSIDLEQDSV